MNNRITAAVFATSTTLSALSEDKIQNLEETAKLDSSDWLTFGDKSSRALLAGLVSADEAQTLYGIHSRYNGSATLAERLTYLRAMGEILPSLR